MSVHPPPPADLAELVEAYAQTTRNVIDLGRTMRAGDESLATDCPGWTVLDQVAHVASAEAMVAGEPEPDVDVSHHAHVRHPFGERMERYVESRRGRELAEVLDELEERLEEGLALYRSGMAWAETTMTGPFGPTTLGEMLGVRLFDIWVHEQDIREALGRPGGLDTPAAAHTIARLFAALPRIVARTAAIEPGNAVVLDLTGPTVGRAGARVEEHEGRAVGVPLFTGESEEHPDVVTTSLTMSTQVAGRLAGGRRAPDDVHVVVSGDDAVAQRVLAALTITP